MSQPNKRFRIHKYCPKSLYRYTTVLPGKRMTPTTINPPVGLASKHWFWNRGKAATILSTEKTVLVPE
jgi:hypothetical protein